MRTEIKVSETIRKTLLSLKVFTVHFYEDYEIRLHPTFPTACWRWDEKEKKHKILIGLGNGLGKKFEKFPEYMKSFGFHEFSHSLYTEKNMKGIQSEVELHNIPFSLYNLFEDARIEELWRKRFKRKFEWIRYERKEETKLIEEIRRELNEKRNEIEEWKEHGKSYILGELASKVFFLFVQNEGERWDKRLGLDKTEKALMDRIYRYYQETISKESSWGVVQVCKEFKYEFGIPPADKVPQLLLIGDIEVSDADFGEAWENGIDLTTLTESTKNGKGEKGNTEYRDGDPIVQFSREKVSLDWNRVEKEVQKLLKIFRVDRKRNSSVIPSKKLNTKRLALDREDIYLREQEKRTGIKPFTVIVDCSGSMDMMTPHQHFLVAVFSELVRKVRTESYLILTKNREAQLFKLPVDKDVIERIPYDGGRENILGGILKFESYILKTKYVFVISDMIITDYWDGTENKIKDLRKRGIEVIGIYRGSYYDEARENVKFFFEKFVVCKDTNPIDLLIPILKTLT